jgi:hypothetical protein
MVFKTADKKLLWQLAMVSCAVPRCVLVLPLQAHAPAIRCTIHTSRNLWLHHSLVLCCADLLLVQAALAPAIKGTTHAP